VVVNWWQDWWCAWWYGRGNQAAPNPARARFAPCGKENRIAANGTL
jgi:hypothetical protein